MLDTEAYEKQIAAEKKVIARLHDHTHETLRAVLPAHGVTPILTEDFEALVRIAHTAVHPTTRDAYKQANVLLSAIGEKVEDVPGFDNAAQKLLDAIFEEPEEQTATPTSNSYRVNDFEVRLQALNSAIGFAQLVQSHRDSTDAVFDLVQQAEANYNFLIGGSRIVEAL